MNKRLSAFLSIIALFLFSSIAFAQSQATTGLIQGTVTDPNGAVVQGAAVNVKNTETGFERTVTTNSDGFFSAPLLPLGKYRVTTDGARFFKFDFGKRPGQRWSDTFVKDRNENRRRCYNG